MKRMTVCVIILLFLISISVAGILHIKHCTQYISAEIDNILDDMRNGNNEDALKKAEAAKKYWEDNTVFSFIYLSQNKLIEVNSSFSKIIGLAKENSDEVIAECLSLKTYIHLLYKTELPSIENIL